MSTRYRHPHPMRKIKRLKNQTDKERSKNEKNTSQKVRFRANMAGIVVKKL